MRKSIIIANLSNLPNFATYFLRKKFSGETVAIFFIVIVSHSMEDIRRMCDRVMWIDNH